MTAPFPSAAQIAEAMKIAEEMDGGQPPAPERAPGNPLPFSYQEGVGDWMQACFGPEIAADIQERNHRFLEEALELVQSTGCTASEAHQLVDYVFGRPVGEPHQDVGGVMVTLAALCNAAGLDIVRDAQTELARVWTKVEQIRAKQAAKPKHSPLPGPAPDPLPHGDYYEWDMGSGVKIEIPQTPAPHDFYWVTAEPLPGFTEATHGTLYPPFVPYHQIPVPTMINVPISSMSAYRYCLTNPDAKAVTVTLCWLSLYGQVDDGPIRAAACEIEIKVKDGRAPAKFVQVKHDMVRGNSTSPFRRSYRVELEPMTGPAKTYGVPAEIEVHRLSPDDGCNTKTMFLLESITEEPQ